MLLRTHVANGAFRGLGIAGALFLSRVGEAIAYSLDIQAALMVALIATLVFAIALMMFTRNAPAHATGSAAIVAELAYLAVGGLGGFLSLWALQTLTRPSPELYCMPEIPWRASIAGFGGFSLGLLEVVINRRGLASLLGPAAYLGFFWIAPWYGFFQPAAFLAQALGHQCEQRSLPALATALAAMVSGRSIGAWLADWLTRP